MSAKQEGTRLALEQWAGHLLKDGIALLPRTVANKMTRGGLTQVPEYVWNPVPDRNIPGWDDQRLDLIHNTSGYKSVAHLGIEWLLGLLGHSKPWLVLVGENGMGKTHLAVMLAKFWVLGTNQDAHIINWSIWLMQRRESYGNGKRVSLQELINVHFLVIDDIGLECKEHSLKHLYMLLEGRAVRPTMITMNLSLGEYKDELLLKSRGKDNVAARLYARNIADRLNPGPGGRVHKQLAFSSPQGSYRKIVRRRSDV